MRAKDMFGLQSVFLGLGLLVLTPSVNPTTMGAASNPVKVQSSLQKNATFSGTESTGKNRRKDQREP